MKSFTLHIMQAVTMPFDAGATAAEPGVTAAISLGENTKGTKMLHKVPSWKGRQQREQ